MKRLLKIVLAVFFLILITLVVVPFVIDANQFRPLLESNLTDALGRAVKLGDLNLSLWHGHVSATAISIADDPAFSKEPFLKAESLAVSVEVLPILFSRKLNVTAVNIDKPEVRLILATKGDWNFSTLGKKTTPAVPEASASSLDLAVKLVQIADGHITLIRPGAQQQDFRDIDVELRNLSATTPVDFLITAKRATGGSVKIEGKAGPLAADALPPLEAKFTVPPVDLGSANLVDKSTGVEAIAGFSGSIKTNGNNIDATGDFRAEKWKLVTKGKPAAKPLEVAFKISHNVARRTGVLQSAAVQIGKAALNLTGNYSLATANPSFVLKLKGDKMPLTELAAALPALDIVLPAGASLEAGTLTMSTNVAGTLAGFSAIGPIAIENVKLAKFDLGTKMRVIETLAGIPATPTTEIQTLSATVKHAPEGTFVDDLTLIVPTIGNLSGSGTVSVTNDLDFNMRALVHTSGAIMRAVGQKGDTTIPFQITGNASDPVFKPNLKALAKEKVDQLTKDPAKAINAAKSIFDMFRKPAEETKAPDSK